MTHPREVFEIEGAESAEAAFADALRRGRLHHAWMLVGPQGVGKATFAYRAARRLLGAAPDERFGILGADPDDRVSRQVAARSHPDLLVLERDLGDGKPRRNITVDEARQLPEFFSKAPAAAPYRVAIIDAADDLNINAANAVLKTLEEPPERGVMFLISNSPGKLLPTIRSRCRRLSFQAWGEERAAEFLSARLGTESHEAALLAHMAHGAPGRALKLAEEGALEIDRTAQDILRRLPERDEAELLGVAESFRGAAGARRFELVFERLADRIHEMAAQSAASGEGAGLERWAEAWSVLAQTPGRAEALNLDRADAFWTAMAELTAAARV